MIKQAIIPLAGLGTRMLPLTSVTPKELLPINGKPNLEYILEECLEAGVKQFIFIISQKKKSYIETFYDDSKENLINSLEYQSEEIIRTSLIKFSGIGNWTCDMVLIFYLNRINIFPTSDLIIKKTSEKLRILENKKIDFVNSFSPYLSIFSLHLWKMSKRVL